MVVAQPEAVQQHHLLELPYDLSMEDFEIFDTLAFWLTILAISSKEIGQPFLKFDETNLLFIIAWNLFNDMWSVNGSPLEFNSIEFPLSILVLHFPWLLFLWFVYDHNI